jgi:hypothetical protein
MQMLVTFFNLLLKLAILLASKVGVKGKMQTTALSAQKESIEILSLGNA